MKKKLPARLQQFLLLFSFCTAVGSLSARSPDSTIFRDDFDRATLGAFWQATPVWSILNGAAYSFNDGIGGKLRTTEGYNDSSYVIETEARGFTVNYMREFRITFGQANLSKDSMYVLSYKPYDGGLLTLSLSTQNIYFPKTLDEAIIYPNLTSDLSYTFKIARYKSGLIQVYLNKGDGYGTTPLLETIDRSYSKAGHIGWQTDTQSYPEDFFVDWITTYRPSQEKSEREKPTEDDLITQVSAKSGKLYTVDKLKTGVKEYIDRDYTITSVPGYLDGASFIQPAMDDKFNTSDTFLTFFLKKDAIVYIAYDPRATAKPKWLDDWTKTSDRIGTSDGHLPYLEIYSKSLQAGDIHPNPISLGGNLASPGSGSEVNYLVAAIQRPNISPLQAEDALLSGAVVANDHPGYIGTGFADYINASGGFVEWTVKIDVPGTYTLGFTYANGALTDRPLEISTDGKTVGTVSFSATSSWSSWAFVSGNDVFLTSGIHKIRATSTGSNGPNIDQLSLFYNSSSSSIISAKKMPQAGDIVKIADQSAGAYPNPFIQTTTVYYNVKQRAHVLLSVYNFQGQQVQLLENGIKDAGTYKTAFDARRLLAGTYFYRLQIGNVVKAGRLVKE